MYWSLQQRGWLSWSFGSIMTPSHYKIDFLPECIWKKQIEIHPNLWTINESYLFESQVGLHPMQGHPLHKMHFSQASSAVLVWPGSRSMGTSSLMQERQSHRYAACLIWACRLILVRSELYLALQLLHHPLQEWYHRSEHGKSTCQLLGGSWVCWVLRWNERCWVILWQSGLRWLSSTWTQWGQEGQGGLYTQATL